tara:strand:- start:248 stop:448 length:201 start_codon:yes stop_codon:yes gene_type:complete
MEIKKLLIGFVAAILLLGCESKKAVQYKTISFADTNGVTTVYYPVTMEKDIVVPDDGKAKLMLIKP